MVKTEYLFCEWTDLVEEGGRARIKVKEQIKIGEDVWRNCDEFTKVELFSSCFKPASMKIEGERVVGIVAENRQGEYFFFALLEEVAPGEVQEIRVRLEGKYTTSHLIPEGRVRYIYKSNFAWIGPHLQRLSFPGDTKSSPLSPREGRWGSTAVGPRWSGADKVSSGEGSRCG